MTPTPGNDTPGSGGSAGQETLGVGTGTWVGFGVAGMQEGVGTGNDGDTDGQGSGVMVGVGSLGGEGVGRQSGRLGRDGRASAGSARPADEAAWWQLGWGVLWSQFGLRTTSWRRTLPCPSLPGCDTALTVSGDSDAVLA